MAPDPSDATSEDRIRELFEDRVKATRAGDIDGCHANAAPDVLLFDVVHPLQYGGADGERRRLEEWFSQFEDGPIGFELPDLSVMASDDVAFGHSLNPVSATTKTGQTLDMWCRTTLCFRRINRKWMIAHEHSSVPFDIETGMAALGLVP